MYYNQKNNKLYYTKYILCLCQKNKEPIYKRKNSIIKFDNKYKVNQNIILDIINYDELFNKNTRENLWCFDNISFYKNISFTKDFVYVNNKKIIEDNFLYLSVISEDIEQSFDDITAERLFKELTIDEYIKFCNDYKLCNLKFNE